MSYKQMNTTLYYSYYLVPVKILTLKKSQYEE
jgi:hypothetical protein